MEVILVADTLKAERHAPAPGRASLLGPVRYLGSLSMPGQPLDR